jgi:hypothetical protein
MIRNETAPPPTTGHQSTSNEGSTVAGTRPPPSYHPKPNPRSAVQIGLKGRPPTPLVAAHKSAYALGRA